MWIFDEKKLREKKVQDRACEVYDEQIKNIGTIIGTKWYEELKAYFERERETTKDFGMNCKKEDLERLQEKYKLTNWFIEFLENFERKLIK